jgi:hypothetical protein
MAQPIITDSSAATSLIQVRGGESYADSVIKTFTPKHWIQWYDSTSYHSYDSVAYVPSAFAGHILKPSHNIAIPYPQENRNWLFGTLFIITLLYIYIQNNFQGRYIQVKSAFLVKRYFSQLVRDGNIFRERIVIPIYLIYFIGLSLLIYSVFDHTVDISKIPLTKLNFFLAILLAILTYFFAKTWLINIMGHLFYTKAETETYLLEHLLFSALFSLFLIPLMWVYTYTNWGAVLILAGGILIILWSIRIVKAIINWSRVFTVFKLFLYLCTLELLPIFLLGKIIFIGISRLNV